MSKKFEQITNSKNKKVSICFADSKAFNSLLENRTEKELASIYNALEKTANDAIDSDKENLKKALNTVAKFDGKKSMQNIVEDARARADKYTEKIENLEKENSWWRQLQGRIILALGEEEEEE